MKFKNDCVFCQIVAGTTPSWKVHETEHAYAFLDINPVNEYHTLVIPKMHFVNVLDAPVEEIHHVMAALKHVVNRYHNELGIENIEVVSCAGEAAQQDVFHMHFHIVPRHSGDGQDTHWTTHPEMVDRFDDLLARLK